MNLKMRFAAQKSTMAAPFGIAVAFVFAITITSLTASAQTPLRNSASKVSYTPQQGDCNKIFLAFQKAQTAGGQRQMKKNHPSRVDALICFEPSQDRFLLDALYTLDSLYTLIFKTNNGRFYKFTIVGYDDAEPLTEAGSNLARKRAVAVFNYFSSREETEYIVKTTASTYFNSCQGDVEYFIHYKVPFDFKWINLFKKSESERLFQNVSLSGKCHIIIEEDPESCLGSFFDYYTPHRDTTLVGSHSKIKFFKGSLSKTIHTKDTIPYNCSIQFKDVISFEELTGNYHMIPHQRFRIINCGYFVINSPQIPRWDQCKHLENYPDSIFISVPIEEHQLKGNLKFYAKQRNQKGEIEYKMMPTKRQRDKEAGATFLVGAFNAFQCDTIYLGRKILPKDMGEYFYPANHGEPGAFPLEDVWLKPYRLNKRGELEMKKNMIPLLRNPKGGNPVSE